MSEGSWRSRLLPRLAHGGRTARETPRLVFIHLPRTGGTAIQHFLEDLVGAASVARIRLPADVLGQLADLRAKPIVIGHFFYPVIRLLPETAVATVVRDPVERSISVWEYLQWQQHHPDHEVLGARGIRSLDEFAEDALLAGHVRNNQTQLLGCEYDIESIVSALEAGEIDLPEAVRLTGEAERAPANEATLRCAKKRLAGMVIVGVTEELAVVAGPLEEHLGASSAHSLEPENVSPHAIVARRSEAYGRATRERLAELNSLDEELYAFARELWSSRHASAQEDRPDAVRG